MQDKDLYTIAVLRYKEENQEKKLEDLFPLNWNLNDNYHLKIEIIAEALQKKILVEETELYKKMFLKDNCKILTNKKDN